MPTSSCRCRIRARLRRSDFASRRHSFELGIIRNHYVGRTFIQPGDSIRHMGVKLKHNANRRMIEGKRVVLVDRQYRARHHQPENRADGARCRRQGSAYAHRLAADERLLLLWRRHAGEVEAAGVAHVGSKRWPSLSGSIRSASSRSTDSTVPSAKPAATTTSRNYCGRLLHRPVSDPPARLRRPRQCAHAVASGEQRGVG